MNYEHELGAFRSAYSVTSKGRLASLVQLTRAFSNDELPIDADKYLTDKKGQVSGLSGSNLKTILAEHGITNVLAREGGRTSRGNIELMRGYAAFINDLPRPIDFIAIENYWIVCVRDFFAQRPFKLNGDSAQSITSVVDNLLQQAEGRQKENPGTMYVGEVLQYLVAAKLNVLLPATEIHGASEADDQTGRMGDFPVGDTVIHCTTAPTSTLIEKCRQNLQAGLSPIIITIATRVNTAQSLLEDAEIGGRVEVWSVQQFLATNVFEHGSFDNIKCQDALTAIIKHYNDIIDKLGEDPSLRIEFK